ncbi:hypothetical protein B0H15DRAFT_508982 [Mycena belliarum]|uniref:Uncharacterized protein n=1 Tax=Mycena belliarum TaxID=1033014 RepID=A0AAD6XU69_9AGAR|nr:hypothetical protein B0H15DRAFT_508982 [Mycena belliae]
MLSPPEASSSSTPSSPSSPSPSSPSAARRAPSDVFRPRLPLDPFAPHTAHAPHPAPPRIDPDAPWPARDLPALAEIFAAGPRVLLVLGAPAPHALLPLLRSPTFAGSLVLYVTHAPPSRAAFPAPGVLQPALRILRLRARLDSTAPAFALALVAVLDAAAAVGRAWRASPDPGPPDIIQLAQDAAGAFAVPEPLADTPGAQLAPELLHPAASFTPRSSRLAPTPAPARPISIVPPPRPLSSASLSALSVASSARSSRPPSLAPSVSSTASASSRRRSRRASKSAPSAAHIAGADDGTRAFDALLSFLPPAHPEKAVLKHVVLVSTLAGAFLAGPAFSPSPTPHSNSNSTSNSTSRRASRAYSGQWGTPYAHGLSAPGSAASIPLIDTSSRAPSPAPSSAPSLGPGHASVRSSFRASFLGFVSRSTPPSPRGSVLDLNSTEAEAETGAPRREDKARDAWVRAHIVHVLPASYRSAKLTGALGAFLGSFSPSPPAAASASGSASEHGHGHGHGYGGGRERERERGAKAYVVSERALREVEGVLVGGIDGEAGARGGAWVAGVLESRATTPDRESEEGGDGGLENGNGNGNADEMEREREIRRRGQERERERGAGGKHPYGLPTPPSSDEGQGQGQAGARSATTSTSTSTSSSSEAPAADSSTPPIPHKNGTAQRRASASASASPVQTPPPPKPAKLRRASRSVGSAGASPPASPVHAGASPPASPVHAGAVYGSPAGAAGTPDADAERTPRPASSLPPPALASASGRRRSGSVPDGLAPPGTHPLAASQSATPGGGADGPGKPANARRGSRFFGLGARAGAGRSSPDLRGMAQRVPGVQVQNGEREKGRRGGRKEKEKGRWWVFWA